MRRRFRSRRLAAGHRPGGYRARPWRQLDHDARVWEAGRHFAVHLFAHTKHSRKAGPFSVARLEMDLPFHKGIAYSRVHRRSASPLVVDAALHPTTNSALTKASLFHQFVSSRSSARLSHCSIAAAPATATDLPQSCRCCHRLRHCCSAAALAAATDSDTSSNGSAWGSRAWVMAGWVLRG